MSPKPTSRRRTTDDPFTGSWIYQGISHPGARGLRVRVVAVIRDSGKPDGRVLHSMTELEGGVRADDILEFTPRIAAEGRYSWVTSDASIADLRRE